MSVKPLVEIKNKPRLLSGIQPSGILTLGNYLGALKHWAALQDRYECLYFLADLHTLTVRQEEGILSRNCYDLLAICLAVGLDPERTAIFLQSSIAAHTQLNWLLNCYVYVGELNRMTQFKDKSRKYSENINGGLFSYPVLMAADILLYGAGLVPVGKDQKQHLELARDLATRFNHLYGEVFILPEGYNSSLEVRVRSLQYPERKMSKSEAGLGTVSLLDSADAIRDKFKRAVTDSGREIVCHWEEKPGISNLLNITALLSGKTIAALEEEYRGLGYGKFKELVAEQVLAELLPVQKRYFAYRADEIYLGKILKEGKAQVEPIANQTIKRVYEALDLISL